jgi:hypothetical protein
MRGRLGRAALRMEQMRLRVLACSIANGARRQVSRRALQNLYKKDLDRGVLSRYAFLAMKNGGPSLSVEATYTRLRSGDWGLRIPVPADASPPGPGEAVPVRLKDGRRKTENIGRLIWSGPGVVLASLARPAPIREPSQRSASTPRRGDDCPLCAQYCVCDTGRFCAHHHDGCDRCGAEW